jgi:hypothetical protein
MDWGRILNPGVLGLLIPIVAIVSWASIAITKMIIAHRERIAMIERGRFPDMPPPPR